MPEAPNCPIYPDNNVWHSSIQNLPVHAMSATWLANMGGPSRLLHPDFGGPYGYQLQVVDNTTPTRRVSFDYADESDDVGYPFTASTPIEPASDAHAFMLNKTPASYMSCSRRRGMLAHRPRGRARIRSQGAGLTAAGRFANLPTLNL